VLVSPHAREILEPLTRVTRWLAGWRDAQGRIMCPEHGVEHTGKSAYAIVLAARLCRLDPQADRAWLLELARGQARRVVSNLVREGTSPCHTFRPGRHDPFNCSNSVIDGGACADALAEFVREFGAQVPAEEREAARAACLLHARTYLRYAVLDKGIPAQRAWGLTGLAAAWSLERDPVLEAAAIEAIGVLEGIAHADGSYPYHPVEWGGEHPGSSDVSSFYHSRIPGFVLHALGLLCRDPRSESFAAPLARALEFLLALVGPDGLKPGLLEAKPWYWGAHHEVASHPFDVHALCLAHQLSGRVAYAEAAAASFRAWVAHLKPSGEPQSHLPAAGSGRSYQCPLFWAAHAAWIARVAEPLTRALALEKPRIPSPGSIEISVRCFPQAGLARLEDARVVAWVRGARPAHNVHHGGPIGGGLLRVYDKPTGADLLARGHAALREGPEAEWSGRAGPWTWSRGWRSGRSELRFALWLARVDWRAGRLVEALWQVPRVLRRGVLDYASGSVGSQHADEVELCLLPEGVELHSRLAHPDGSALEASRLVRSYRVGGGALEVEERLLDAGGARALDYRIPRRAAEVLREGGRISYRLEAP
jgi:hypothetical protein